MSAENLLAPDLWAKTVNLVKDRVNNRSLWETMEKVVPITIEDDTLIIGLNARIFNQAGHLSVSDHRNAIDMAIAQIAGRPLKVRVIEGDTLQDWTLLKQRDARVHAMRQASYAQRDRVEATAASWDELYEHVARSYSNTPFRQLPQGKARFLHEMLTALKEAMDKLYPEQPDDTTERLLARVIDRIATSAEVPATLVALELQRMRAQN